MTKKKISYIVWKQYQRRAEVIATELEADLKFMPHLFRSKYLRLFDYLLKLIATFRYILEQKPNVMIFQSPPVYAAIPALLMGVPYIIDAHNIAIQGIWCKLPMTKYLMSKASTVIVHNPEILQIAQKIFPSVNFISILDPLKLIYRPNKLRLENQILVVCSFNSDEPVNVIIETMTKLPNYTFIITADIKKLQPQQRLSLCKLSNVRLTGFLPTVEYQDLLCSSLAALVLTTRTATQPCGACEALSSNTQLVVSNTSLTRKLFDKWAILVDNSADSIVEAIQSLQIKNIDLSSYRQEWNITVSEEIYKITEQLNSEKFNH